MGQSPDGALGTPCCLSALSRSHCPDLSVRRRRKRKASRASTGGGSPGGQSQRGHRLSRPGCAEDSQPNSALLRASVVLASGNASGNPGSSTSLIHLLVHRAQALGGLWAGRGAHGCRGPWRHRAQRHTVTGRFTANGVPTSCGHTQSQSPRKAWMVCCVLPPGDEPGNTVRSGWLGAASTGQGTRELLDLRSRFSLTLRPRAP